MRWQGLFDDLDAQAVALELAERAGEVDERTRGEIGTLHWHDRVRAAVGLRLRIRLTGGASASGVLTRVGPDWLLLDEQDGREVVVVASAVLAIRGLDRHSATAESESAVSLKLGLRHVLRGIARDRSVVRVQLADGSVIDATIDRVGADFAEVATRGEAEFRRRQDVRDVELVPFHAVTAVRRSL